METLFFAIVALVAIISGILVITCKNPINNALALIMTFFCLATFYVTLDAPFMAAIQVIVYAGAIMVLIVFVIMLLNLRAEVGKRSSHALFVSILMFLGILAQTLLLVSKGAMTGAKGTILPEQIAQLGHTELIGKTMFTSFLLPFEVTSVLLLAAIVGAVVLSKKKL
ncbi:MAG: NADH-quinone oxidoreductase subunit J [Desulfuromonadia bacterium]